MDGTNYNVWTHSSWSQYSVVLLAGDTLSVRTIYNQGSSAATSVNYLATVNSSTTVNDPDPTTSDTGLDRTWSTSSFSNSNHHSRWLWFTATGVGRFASIRILTIPTTMGWNSIQASIEQGYSGSATLSIPSSFEAYIQGTASESGDNSLSTNGSYDERFHWRITSSSTSNTAASGFSSSSGNFIGPSNGDSITISPSISVTPGTYYAKLYFYDYNGNTATSNTLIDSISFTVTAAASLDTTISLNSTSITTYSSDTYYTQSLTGGGSNTIYYIFNASNIANGSNLESLRTGGDSRYIARTFSTASSRPFSTSGSGTQITNDLPSSSDTSKTYYVYATDGNGQNSVKLTNTYTVTLTALAPTVSATKAIITNGFGLYSNPTGTTSGTVTYQWSTNGGGPNSKSPYSTGYTSNQTLGVGTDWVGTTWTCQARATVDNGSTYVYSGTSSTTLPIYEFDSNNNPTSVQEGQSGTFTVNSTNGLGPIYWQVTPSSQFPNNGDSGQITDYSTSTNEGSFSVTPLSDSITETSGTTATIKLYINNTFNSSNYIYAEDTFTITDPPATPTAPVVSNTQTFAGTESATTTCTIALTSSGTNGTLEYNVTTDTTVPTQNWNTSATVSVSRGTTYYFWARRAVGYEDRTDSAITVPYLSDISDNTITIGTPEDKNGTALNYNNSVWEIPSSYGTTAADYIDVPFTDGGTYDQYIMKSNNASLPWVSTAASVGGSSYFRLVPTNDLPAANGTFTYYFEGKRTIAGGGDGVDYVSVNGGATISIKRLGVVDTTPDAPTFTNITNATTNQEYKQSFTTTGVTSGQNITWTGSGGMTLSTSQNGTYSTSITRQLNEVGWAKITASSNPSTSVTGVLTSGSTSSNWTITTASSGGSGGSTAGGSGTATYGLAVYNSNGTNQIFGSSHKSPGLINYGNWSVAANGTSTSYSAIGMTTSNTTEVNVILTGVPPNLTSPAQITRSTNSFTITNSSSTALSGTFYVIRA